MTDLIVWPFTLERFLDPIIDVQKGRMNICRHASLELDFIKVQGFISFAGIQPSVLRHYLKREHFESEWLKETSITT